MIGVVEIAMSPQQAVMVFAQFGIAAVDLATPASLKAARNRLLMQVHSDHAHGGTDAAASSVNAAYDVLKRLPAGHAAGAGMAGAAEGPALPDGWVDRRASRGAADWMPDRRARRPGADASAGATGEEYLAYYYDGALRPAVAMQGARAAFPAIAQAVIALHGRARGFGHRGVLLGRPRSADLLLVHLDGHDLRQPVAFTYDALARSPGDDEQFLRQLPGRLAAIARSRDAFA